MKWFVASTYSAGNVIVKARNKNDAIQFLNENNYDTYAIDNQIGRASCRERV